MNTLVEFLWTLCLFVYYWLEGVVKALLPAEFLGKKDVSGQIVLVTGGAMGLGKMLAQKFSRRDAKIVLWDINKDALDKTTKELKEEGATVYSYVCNLCNKEEIYKVAQQVKNDVGDVDILINNAGIVTGKKFMDCDDGLMMRTMDVNVIAHFWATKAFLPSMMQRNHGHIVSIASCAGLFGVSGQTDYCASKFGAVGFDEALRMELATQNKTGVKTTVVCPYFISTGMFKGTQNRFSFLEMLTPEYVTDKIMDAILTNQIMLIVPRLCYIAYALKGLLPVKCTLVMSQFLGLDKAMDSFVGRDKQS